jgi:hypothetical protein
VEATATTSAMETAAATTSMRPAAVPAVLGECRIRCNRKSCESSKNDQGSKKKKSNHKPVPSSLAAHFRCGVYALSDAVSNQIPAQELRRRGNHRYQACSWNANDGHGACQFY